MSLPNIPGLLPSVQPAAAPRRQTLTFKNGYALSSELAPGLLSSLPSDCTPVSAVTDCGDNVQLSRTQAAVHTRPSWLEHDKKVLRFDAFFEETVPEGFSATERSRIRKLEVLYFLENDTVTVSEPRIPKLAKIPDGFVSCDDVRIGGDLQVGSLSVQICGVDSFTRDFYEKRGKPQADNFSAPPSELGKSHVRVDRAPCMPDSITRGMQFLANDGKVLRFDGVVTERDCEPRLVVVHFFLADSSIEIKEKEKNGSMLLHRQRLPVIARSAGVAAVGDDPSAVYVQASALMVGESIPVYARRLLLIDADPFTRNWYDMVGSAQPAAVPPPPPPPPPPMVPPPPHDGYGSPSDSIRNVGTLMPKKAVDVAAFERFQALSDVMLRFTAKIIAASSGKPLHATDEGRQFVLTVYLEDDSISIYEQPQRDIPGGRYLERIQVPSPGRPPKASGPAYYAAADFNVGSSVDIFGRCFLLTSADKFSENHLAAARPMPMQAH